ncbi:MAG: ABC transporter permease [Myxococcota bacterium]|nr:ABC transporter permease [Myxococcota bacterium]
MRLRAATTWLLAGLLLLPLLGLFTGSSPVALWAALQRPGTLEALGLSVWTSALALAISVLVGTPLAWWLSRPDARSSRPLSLLLELPLVLPPAVLGVALLQTFGRQGLLGPSLSSLGVEIPFTVAAVVLAQVVVGAPLYVLAASSSLREVDPELLLVARTLGASRWQAFTRVALPTALPGLVGAAGLAWARSLGEFGATLMFAGNLPGRTQTLPLAIFQALERDLEQAQAMALLLLAVALVLLLALRGLNRGELLHG